MAEHSPTPWRVKQNSELSNWLVIRPDKTVVCAAWREADAAFIVEAVNGVEATRELQRKLLGWSIERDRLSDLVRRLADELGDAIEEAVDEWRSNFEAEWEEPDFTSAKALLREAREALGEDKP